MLTPYQKDLLLQGEREIEDCLDEIDEVIPFKYTITSYGADYPVDGLVKRISMQDIIIPKFQRGYVWSLKEASRFVESLLLGLPVPSIFLSKEPETKKLLVIDGQQRLSSLRYFYEGLWPSTRKEFALRGVDSKFEGATYKSLANDDRRRLDDSIVHAIVVKQNEPSDDSSSIYHIFERLNTSGVSLTAQEIRTAIHHGEFSDLLKDLNAVDAWRAVYGPVNKLMREHLTAIPAEKMRSAFILAIEAIHKGIGSRSFRLARVLNAAVFDAVMVGVARRLDRGAIADSEALRSRYKNLIEDPRFLAVAERATADEESVSKRLDLSTVAFADIR
jgi:hypothetical protein